MNCMNQAPGIRSNTQLVNLHSSMLALCWNCLNQQKYYYYIQKNQILHSNIQCLYMIICLLSPLPSFPAGGASASTLLPAWVLAPSGVHFGIEFLEPVRVSSFVLKSCLFQHSKRTCKQLTTHLVLAVRIWPPPLDFVAAFYCLKIAFYIMRNWKWINLQNWN